MPRHIIADRLLLHLEKLGTLEFLGGSDHSLMGLSVFRSSFEEVDLPRKVAFLHLFHIGQQRVRGGKHCPAGQPEAVAGATPNQRFQRLAAKLGVVHPAAQVIEVGIGTVLLPLFNQRPHHRASEIFHREEAETNPLFPDRGEALDALIDIGRKQTDAHFLAFVDI